MLQPRHNSVKGVDIMAEIIPIRDLRNTAEISELCHIQKAQYSWPQKVSRFALKTVIGDDAKTQGETDQIP